MKNSKVYCTFCSSFSDSCSCVVQDSAKPKESSDTKKAVPISEKAKNFSKSLFNHARNGFVNVENKVQKKRIEICEKCESYDRDSISCQACGCHLLMKTSWASESCPEGKWGPEKIKEQDIRKSQSPGECGGCGRKKT